MPPLESRKTLQKCELSRASCYTIFQDFAHSAGPSVRIFSGDWDKPWVVVKFLGYLLAWSLFGALSTQACKSQIPHIRLDYVKPLADIYYLAFAKDPLWTRAAIFFLYILQTVQICLLSQFASVTFGPGFDNMESMDSIQHIWFSVPIMSSVGKS